MLKRVVASCYEFVAALIFFSRMANFDFHQQESRTLDGKTGVSGFGKYSVDLMESALTWDLLKWLVNYSKVPVSVRSWSYSFQVIVKGVMRGDDAIKCLELGAKGIIVSNHGGRQLDSAPSTIEALPEVVRAVNGRCPVMVDGGIRTGTDVFKAIALGADKVFIGRPIVYGLAILVVIIEMFRTFEFIAFLWKFDFLS